MSRDWKCFKCGYLVFGSKNTCGKCGHNKHLGEQSNRGGRGDWHCSCGELNFASRQACRKCNASRKETKENPKPRAGDWLCTCKEMNFGNRVNCFKCGAPRNQDSIQGGDGKCGICMAEDANICLKNCGHIAMCYTCATGLKTCPVCRKEYNPVTDLIRTFKAV